MRAENRLARATLIVASITLSCAPTPEPRLAAPSPPVTDEALAVEPGEAEPISDPAERAHAMHLQVKDSGKEEVARAKERLEKARAALQKAMAEIEKKRPSDSAFTAATSALEALDRALDQGNDVEAKDLPYARLALAARKELRSKRDRIEARRLELRIEISREDIELALADLKKAFEPVEGKAPSTEQFDRARAAADEVVKALGRGQALVGKEEKYTAWVAEVKKRVEAKRRAIDDRQIGIAVELQRARVEEARKVLSGALAPLAGKEIADAQFTRAEQAAAAVAKLLEEGKSLESKQRAYAAYAAQVEKQVAGAKRQIDVRRTELVSARQKLEIEEMRKSLDQAVRALNKRRPADELFVEAEKAADIVKRMLDAAAALPAKSRPFAQYVNDAKRALRATEVEITKRKLEVHLERQHRSVEKARAVLSKSISQLRGRSISEERFKETEALADELEKVLAQGAGLAKKDREYATYHREVKKRIREARERIAEKRDEVAVARTRSEVQSARGALAGALRRLQGRSSGDAEVGEAGTAATVLEKTMEAAAPLRSKDARFADYLADSKKFLGIARRAIDERKLQLAVAGQSREIEEAVAAARAAVESATAESATSAVIAKAAASMKTAGEALAKGAPLEAQDRRYRAFAAKVTESLQRLEQELSLAEHMIAFRMGPIVAMSEGLSAAEAGARATELRAQRDAYARAVDRFQACRTGSADLIAEHPRIAQVDFSIGDRRADAKGIISMCADHAESEGKKLSHVNGILAVYDGPAKSFEQAEALLQKAAKEEEEEKNESLAEALTHIESCLVKAKILEYKHPKLAKQPFDVAGGKMTLSALIDGCQERAKKIRAELRDSKS